MSSSMDHFVTLTAQIVTAVAVEARCHFLGWVVVIGGALLSPYPVGEQSRASVMRMRTSTSHSLRKYLPSADAVVARTGQLAGKDTR